MICDSIPRDKVATADGLLAKYGVDFSIQRVIDKVDFDPELAMDTADRVLDLHDQLSGGAPPGCPEILAVTDGEWDGPARTAACDHAECQRDFWDQVLDFLLWLAQQIVQLLDYIIDALRVIVAWLTWLATALAALALVIAVAVGLFTAGVGTVVTAVAESPALAVLGVVAGLGVAASLLLYGLNKLVEWLQTVIEDARAKICGKGLPSLPDFDPDGPWFPPAFPQ